MYLERPCLRCGESMDAVDGGVCMDCRFDHNNPIAVVEEIDRQELEHAEVRRLRRLERSN